MTRKRSAVLAAGLVLGLLAPAATASAAVKPAKSPNLVRDGGAESAKPTGTSGTDLVPVPGWTRLAGTGFTAVKYGTPEFITKTDIGPKARGKNFFTGGEVGPSPAVATQLVPLKKYAAWAASGKAKFTLSGWFGGFSDQRDYATLTVTWEDATGAVVGKPTVIGDVTHGQRKNLTGLRARSKSGLVPKAATQAMLKLKMIRLDGGYDDGYADNLGLVLTKK